MMSKLTAKQEFFCQEYMKDLNATQAAIRAGYSENTARQIGTENLAKLAIQEKIIELKTVRIETVQIDAKWVLMSAKKVFDRCMQEEQVTDREGAPIGEYKFEHSGANKALEIIGKHVDVKAFEVKSEGNSDSLADSVSKLIDKLPN